MADNNNSKKLRDRNEIEAKYKWNLEAMYADEEIWESDFKEGLEMAEKYASYAGHLGDSADTLYNALSEKDAIWQKIEKVYVYARMRKDEDNRA